MKIAILSALFLTLTPGLAAAEGGPQASRLRSWNFDGDKPGAAPSEFSFARTGDGRPGRWVAETDETAPSARNVLAQTDADDTDYRFPVAVADAPELADLKLSVRFKTISGKVDQGAGLVFRYRDPANYYVVRANALEDNVRLYRVVNGSRRQFAGWNGKVASGTWHALAAEARGDRFQVSFDGKPVIDASDKTFASPGKVGVWTKADSVIHFDDLTVEPVSP